MIFVFLFLTSLCVTLVCGILNMGFFLMEHCYCLELFVPICFFNCFFPVIKLTPSFENLVSYLIIKLSYDFFPFQQSMLYTVFKGYLILATISSILFSYFILPKYFTEFISTSLLFTEGWCYMNLLSNKFKSPLNV